MAFAAVSEKYSGKMRTLVIGTGDKSVAVGGQATMPFCDFDGELGKKPLIAMEVYDVVDPEWPAAVVDPFKDVINDPVAWAKKNVDEYGAKMICLQLAATDPNGENKDAAYAADLVKKVAGAISVPLMVWGSGNVEKDAEVLAKVCEACEGMNLLVGPAVEENYKKIAAAALGYGHCVVSQSPIDVNMAKQMNILISNLGLPLEKIIMEPSTGALGYGVEYSYSVMERISLAALSQNDEKMQCPMINDLGKECWKSREVKLTVEEEPAMGPDMEKRGVLWEAMTAVDMALCGSNLLIMRNPHAVKLVEEVFTELS
ncbi:MAG: acetyl-CoA decarbonylase/synthase complex subunit delta [Deltaproteobacteria bacterium]|nr:acetyl-CoA decarbonylase/synthase complex subunit delta [Candidatus Anaeroferrophillus wilburensis]MBN2888863.1 acetyl-CoA decarbonylase/synthase complex subunit delta [Deltaproteobacteria bacterium]